MADKKTPEQLKKDLLAMSVEDINDTYHQGYITALDKNRLLLKKAHATVEQTLSEKGYLGAIFSQTVKHVQEGWDNLKESVNRPAAGTSKTVGGVSVTVPQSMEDVKNEAYYAGLAVWGEIQMLTSAFSAFGEVTGQVAENMALKAGASPGLARVINIATDVGTGFLPIGGTARSFARTVRALKGTKAEKTAEVAKLATDALEQGLDLDGVQRAKRLLAEGVNPEGQKAISKIQEMLGKEPMSSVQQDFVAKYKQFYAEMESVTAEQTHAMTAKLAEKYGYTVEDVKKLVPGQAMNEREAYSYLKALEPQWDTVVQMAEKAIAEPTEQTANALAQRVSELFTFAPQFRGAEVTAGRTVDILKASPPMKQITNMLMGWDPEKMAAGNFVGAMQTLAEDIVALKNKPAAGVDLVAQNQSNWQKFKENWWPMAREAYINLLMARPITQVRNFLGNSIASGNSVMERFAGGVFSNDRERGLLAMEAPYLAKGMTLSLRDAIGNFTAAFKKLTPEEVNKFDFFQGQIPGVLGSIIRGPGNMARGMDNAFKTILTGGSYYAQALREGVHMGYEGEKLADFVARRVAHPTMDMMDEARSFALTQTFQNDLGTFGEGVRRVAQYGPLALYFPFMKTPIDLAKYAWNRTPGLQLISSSLYRDILDGGVKADMAIGRLTVSNLIGHFLFDIAKEGFITGNGPVEPSLRRGWLDTNVPYSIRTKNGFWPISNAEPASTLFGMMADYASVRNQLDEPTAGQTAMALTFMLMHDLADKTYWQTMANLIDATSGLSMGSPPTRGFWDVALSPVTNVATGGPFGAGIARAMDPIRRETRGFLDGILARIPNYSKTLPPRLDSYGDPALLPQAVGGNWLGFFSPITYKDKTQDRVKLEGEKLQIKVPEFPWTIGGRTHDDFDIRAPFPEDRLPTDLTPEQRYEWEKIYRNVLRHPEFGMEKALLDNPEYQQAPRALQRSLFMSQMAEYRATAKDALLVQDPALGRKVLENEATQLQPMMTPEQRTQMGPTIRESLSLFDQLAPKERDNLLRWGILEPPEEPAEPVPSAKPNAPPVPVQAAPVPSPQASRSTRVTPVIGR